MANKLIMMVGLPRSGKSTVARNLGHPIVNPDSIRLALHGKAFEPLAEDMVWAIAKIAIRSLFMAGHDTVILDATNVTRKRRSAWKDNEWRREYVELSTEPDECWRRAIATGKHYLLPVIDRMHKGRQPIGEDELDK